MNQPFLNEGEVRLKPHPGDPNITGEYARQIFEYRRSILLFIKDMWHLLPQPVKPEYQAQWEEVCLSTGPNWLRLKETVTAEWFGDGHVCEDGAWEWEWYVFEKGKHISWQQVLILMSIEKAIGDKRLSRHITIESGHGIGKSATVTWIVLWFLYCFFMSQVPVTAPTSNQMHDVLWKELSIWINRMPTGVKELYDWQHDYVRIKYDPEAWFARAKTSTKENTEALAGVHAESVCIAVDEACHDDQTEILTEDGFKLFKDLLITDRVYTQNPSTGKATLELPTKYHEYDFDGHLYAQKRRGSDFAVTPTHDMYVRTRKSGYRKKKANTFTKDSDYFYSRVIDWDGNASLSEDMVRLYAWFITEGSFRWYPGTRKPTGITISQSQRYNASNYQEIITLLLRLGFNPKENKKRTEITVNNVELATSFLECGDGFYNKQIPLRVKTLNKKLLQVFIEVAIKGDGYTKLNGRSIFYTSSPRLADDMQEIILKTGRTSVITKRKIEGQRKWIVDHFGTSSCDGYVVSVGAPTDGKINRLTTVPYKGKVYCVTVPNGLILTRRNGYTMWSGNSGVPEQVFNTAEGALTSGNVWVILISNHTRVIGYFHDSHNKNSDDWQTFSFNCEQSPLVDKRYVHRQAKRHGVTSNEYRVRVKGLAPAEDMMDDSGYLQLIPEGRIIVIPRMEDMRFVGRPKLSIDPSGEGDDACEFCLRDNFKAVIWKSLNSTNDKEIAETAIKIIDQFNLKSEDVTIEGFGKGADAAKLIAVSTKGRISAYVVLPGTSPKDEERLNGDRFTRFDDELMEGNEDGKQDDMYLNLRAVGHFRMRKWLLAGGCIVDNDTEHSDFAEQIACNRYKRTLQGNKIQMMPKKEQQKLRIPSPNKSDALMLSFLSDSEEQVQTKEEKDDALRTQHAVDDEFKVL